VFVACAHGYAIAVVTLEEKRMDIDILYQTFESKSSNLFVHLSFVT